MTESTSSNGRRNAFNEGSSLFSGFYRNSLFSEAIIAASGWLGGGIWGRASSPDSSS